VRSQGASVDAEVKDRVLNRSVAESREPLTQANECCLTAERMNLRSEFDGAWTCQSFSSCGNRQ
jgi:hypothetical protein